MWFCVSPNSLKRLLSSKKSIDVPCFVTPTEGITEARLAYARFEGRSEEMARIAYEASAQFSPQHLIAAIGPTGLPLDPTSAVSLKQSKKQYHDAVLALIEHPLMPYISRDSRASMMRSVRLWALERYTMVLC